MSYKAKLYENRENLVAQARAIAAGRAAKRWAEVCGPFEPFDFSLDEHAKALGEAADRAERAEAERAAAQGAYRNESQDVRAVADRLNRWRRQLFAAFDVAPDLPAARRLNATFEEAGPRDALSPRAARTQIVNLLIMIGAAGGIPAGVRVRKGFVDAGKALLAETNDETVDRDAAEIDRMVFTGDVLRAYQALNNLVVELEDVMGLVELDLGHPVIGLHLGVMRAVRGRAGKGVTDEDLAEGDLTGAIRPDPEEAPAILPPVRPAGG